MNKTEIVLLILMLQGWFFYAVRTVQARRWRRFAERLDEYLTARQAERHQMHWESMPGADEL